MQQQKSHGFIVDVPQRITEGFTEDYVRINIPPSPTPKRVNFSPLPSPSHLKLHTSPGPSPSRGIASVKNLLPKLSFKFRNTNSEIEKAAMLALGCPPDPREKATITRTFSLSKLFTPKMKRTSSLPVTPIAHSNPESTHGGNGNSVVSTNYFISLMAFIMYVDNNTLVNANLSVQYLFYFELQRNFWRIIMLTY